MDNYNIYNDIAERTQGGIYVGVVGPVRTGKSTFIKRFMDLMVIPNIEDVHMAERAKDELPQSASGRTIHTTEPKFIPNEAISINIDGEATFKVRMVDCVGYIVDAALGYAEGDKPKMVSTPWYEQEIPFEEAANIGTRKVISEHSTIGVVVTTDGSITGIQREDYLEAEERVIRELTELNKPFVVVVNSREPRAEHAVELTRELTDKYGVPARAMDVMNMGTDDITDMFKDVLKEFPIKEIAINLPDWIEQLEPTHWLKVKLFDHIRELSEKICKVSDVKVAFESMELDFLEGYSLKEIDMGSGSADVMLEPKSHLFYQIMGEICDLEIKGAHELMKAFKDFYEAKKKYDVVGEALEQVEQTGYGLVPPRLSEMTLETPELYRSGNRFGIKLKASASSLHIIKTHINTEYAPLIGSERESEDIVNSLQELFDEDPELAWKTNMFGKSLDTLLKEGLQKKLYKMPDDVQEKIQRTLEKIINESNGGLICIIL